MTRWDRTTRYTAWLRDGDLRAAVEVSGSGAAWWWRVEVLARPTGHTLRERESGAEATTARAAKRDAERAARECLAHVAKARGGT